MLLDAASEMHPKDRQPTITRAWDANNRWVEVSAAVSGQDYSRPDHPGCILRPVHSTKRRSHFRHKGGQAPDCPEWTNESVEHEKIKTAWLEFLNRQLSGCMICVVDLECNPHPCPVKSRDGESSDPWYKSILWVCGECSKPHVYEILGTGDSVFMEKWVLARSCRPDITVTDSEGNPKAFIEFRKSSSGQSREVANAHNIPWFEIEVLDGVNSNVGLINESRKYWEDWLDLDDKTKESMRRIDLVMAGSTVFMPVFDNEGRLLDTYFTHKPNEDEENITDYLPQPHRGHYLLAHQSNLGCSSQQETECFRASTI